MNELTPIGPDRAAGWLARRGDGLARRPAYARLRGAAAAAATRSFLFFMAFVVVAAGLYFFVVASPVYVSRTEFAVRGKQAVTTIPLLAALGGTSVGMPEATTLQEYIRSYDMLARLDASQHLREQYSRLRPDFVYRMRRHAPQRVFLGFYKGMADVSIDSTSNIITLQVKAFTPAEAQATTRAILRYSSDFIGRMSDQMLAESSRAAQQDYANAQSDALKARAAVTGFRGNTGTLDPQAYGAAANGQLFAVQASITQLKGQLASLLTYSTARSPQVLQVQAQIRNLEGQAAAINGKLTGQRGGPTINNQLTSYQGLIARQTYAEQRLVQAQATLDQSRSVALQRQLFVVPIAQPNLPDAPSPRALEGFATAIALAVCVYGILRLGIASIRDHQV